MLPLALKKAAQKCAFTDACVTCTPPLISFRLSAQHQCQTSCLHRMAIQQSVKLIVFPDILDLKALCYLKIVLFVVTFVVIIKSQTKDSKLKICLV